MRNNDAVPPKDAARIARNGDSDGKPLSKPRQQPASRRFGKRLERRGSALDQASRDALFQEFVLWQERQAAHSDTLDEAGRDALFQEFLLWQERQRKP